MSYKINGTEFLIQPTTGRWLPRETIGVDGNGRQVYVGVRSFELKWQLIDTQTYNQLLGFYNAFSISGTASVDLPAYGNAYYGFTGYAGCVLDEPQIDVYFTEHHLNASMLITNIVT